VVQAAGVVAVREEVVVEEGEPVKVPEVTVYAPAADTGFPTKGESPVHRLNAPSAGHSWSGSEVKGFP